MDIKEAVSLFRYYQQSTRRKRTRESYRFLLRHLEVLFGDREIDSIKPDEIYHFLETYNLHILKHCTVRLVIVGGQSSQWPWSAYIFLIRHESL